MEQTQTHKKDTSEATPTVAILGAGHQGHAFAAYLGLQDVDVTIVNRSESKVNAIQDSGGIAVTGVFEGFVPLDPSQVTTDVATGIEHCDITIVAVPGYGHEYFIDELVGAATDDQIIVVPTDNFASLRFRRKLVADLGSNFTVAGAAISPFPGLSDEPGLVDMHGAKETVPLASIPARETESVAARLNSLFNPATTFTPADSVFEVNLQNLNPYMHSAINLLNLARIDAEDEWLYYGEGCTPAVERVVSAIDDERRAVGEALGIELDPLRDLVAEMYQESVAGDSIVEMLSESPVHRSLPGPTDLGHEYLTEDVPYGLVPLASLSRHLDLPCPTLESTIHILSTATGTAFAEQGITTTELGIAEMDRAELRAIGSTK